METTPTPEPTTGYQQVTVDVPEDRLAEFHAFYARFLARVAGRGRRGRHGHRHPHVHGRGRRCGERAGTSEGGESVEQTAGPIVA